MPLKPGKPVGLLNVNKENPKFSVSRHLPSADLQPFIEHYWIVRWDLRGQEPHLQETLPHPSVHLVFERDHSRIVGVFKGRFSVLLQEQGAVFGIKFRPGAFYPFLGKPVSTLTGRTVPFQEIFGMSSQTLEQQLFSQKTAEQMISLAESFIRERLPEPDPNIDFIHNLVQSMISDRSIVKVDDIVRRFPIHTRQIQQLFRQYVGVSPKWLIQRYRLHEAVETMADGDIPDWSRLAVDLGYYDQAHFIKDFKSIVGKSPEAYTRLLSEQQPGEDR
ncbi:helix-turn-helix domain-containing protein [Paenibacillus nasutitermitis]|uniref:AraC family transcriptional regulator n=1 Tax=Paenibacillus nasutitermitis TaxID=1652958 RepID=A0A916ZEE8_9BACL|nr:AraC family transcriptional regulator [Paenibacillus nasutitermitis]GGD89680.1 AraC family transcriptional regulator [Paenibacillus nasutitermitis]